MSGYQNASNRPIRSDRSSRTQRCQDWVTLIGHPLNNSSRRADSEQRSDRDYYPPTLPPLYKDVMRRQEQPLRSTLSRRSGPGGPARNPMDRFRRTLRLDERLDFTQEGRSRPLTYRTQSRYHTAHDCQELERVLSYRSQESRYGAVDPGSYELPTTHRQGGYDDSRGTQGRPDRLAWEAQMTQPVYSQYVERAVLASGREVNTYEVAPPGTMLHSHVAGQVGGYSQADRRPRRGGYEQYWY